MVKIQTIVYLAEIDVRDFPELTFWTPGPVEVVSNGPGLEPLDPGDDEADDVGEFFVPEEDFDVDFVDDDDDGDEVCAVGEPDWLD